MNMITSQEDFKNAGWLSLIKIECMFCHKHYESPKCRIQKIIKHNNKNYCSSKCATLATKKRIKLNCKQCGKEFEVKKSRLNNITKGKFKNIFCSHSCMGIHSSKNRKGNSSRSKLEKWIEIRLKELYSDLEICFNRADAINSELDIYIPALSLAFELNGEYHYEPIRGKDKLEYIQNNDRRKWQACLEKQIELCVIDTCGYSYFKEHQGQHILDIIKNVINQKKIADNSI